jgi:thymidylate synthase (FAD)
MKLIKPSYEIFDTSSTTDVLRHIELAARTCYKSEIKITADGSSAIDLVTKLIKRSHDAMFEFGHSPIFKINKIAADVLNSININFLENNCYDYYTGKFLELTFDPHANRYLVSGSIRAYRDLIKHHSSMRIVRQLAMQLNTNYGDLLFPDTYLDVVSTTEIALNMLTPYEQLFHDTRTVKFICDRGVSHELVRHRPASYAQESTRYCNYSKNSHVQFIIPCWFDNMQEGIIHTLIEYDKFGQFDGALDWVMDMLNAETKYNNRLNQINPSTQQVDKKFRKWSPQEARCGLPNSLKTEINVKANLREWRHIFIQRVAKAAHPQMRELAQPLLDDFKKQIPGVFDSITY